MTDHVPADQIEQIVGAPRHPALHLARAVSAEQTVYILHSAECLAEHSDLRECPYSRALDDGIHPDDWAVHQDGPVVVDTVPDPEDGNAWLVPTCLVGKPCAVAEDSQ